MANPVPYGLSPILDYGIHKQFSQEFKAAGTAFNDRLPCVTGHYFLRDDNTTDLGTGVGIATSFRVTGDCTLRNSLETCAAYGQIDYTLSDALTASVGLRYTHETKRLFVDTNAGGAGPLFSTALIEAAGIPAVLKRNFVTPRFALSYQANPDLMFYAFATR